MEIDITALPDDPQVLREVLSQVLEALSKSEAAKSAIEAEMTAAIEAAKLAIEEKYLALFNKLFRPRSEKLNEDQLSLIFESLADLGVPQDQLEKLEQKVALEKKPRRKRAEGSGRGHLPASLPRERVEHFLPESERCCGSCGAELTKIREEKSEQLEYIPATLKVIEHVRGVYACKCCEESIGRAPKPPQAIEKGIPGPGLLAQVVVSKYADHLPLYRQQGIFERHGIEISRSTQCTWIASSAKLAAPLVASMQTDTLKSKILKTDDTTVTVLGDNRGSYKGRLWVYLGDRDHPHQIFVYSPDREGKWPQNFLKDYRGYLQADAYSGYDKVHETGVLEVACWAHTRRYFFETLTIAQDKRALVPLGLIKLLFKIEEEAKELDPEARKAMRQERAKPVLAQLGKWMTETRPNALPKSALGGALV